MSNILTFVNCIFVAVIAGCQTQFFICFQFESSLVINGRGDVNTEQTKRHAMVNVHTKLVIKWVDIC